MKIKIDMKNVQKQIDNDCCDDIKYNATQLKHLQKMFDHLNHALRIANALQHDQTPSHIENCINEIEIDETFFPINFVLKKLKS